MSTIIEHLRVILLHPSVKNSLLISGTLQGAIKEIDAMRAVTEAAVLYCTTGQDRGGEKLLDAVKAYREMKK